ncbi:hypothetical protein R1sor_020718 [Riccia sorocarpa]|uniref:RHOMBOID-like protein n=1 Tax=Riccia sorocarpa TaxID=122646 RepID=A0ABD3GEZ4_9MARC
MASSVPRTPPPPPQRTPPSAPPITSPSSMPRTPRTPLPPYQRTPSSAPTTPPSLGVTTRPLSSQQQQRHPSRGSTPHTAFAHLFGLNFVSNGIPLMNPLHPPSSTFFGSRGSPLRILTPRKPTQQQQQQPQNAIIPHLNYGQAGGALQYSTPPGGQSRAGIVYFDGVDRPRFLWIIPTFLLIHVTIFLITMYENNCPGNYQRPDKCVFQFLGRLSFQPLSENPLLGPSYRPLLTMGALESNLVVNGGEGWRLLSCLWLHAGVFHLFANMTGLLSVGIRVEREFGGIRVGTIYIMAGFGGSLLSALFMVNQISVGASGALMGLLGATVAEIIINWSSTGNRNRSIATLVLAVTLTISFGLMPHVDNFAHIGGFATGALWGFLFFIRPRFAWIKQRCCFPMMIHDEDTTADEAGIRPTFSRAQYPSLNDLQNSNPKHTKTQIMIWSLALGILVLGYTAALLVLFKGFAIESRKTCCFALRPTNSRTGRMLSMPQIWRSETFVFVLAMLVTL